MASAYIMRVERKRDRGGVTRRYRVVYPDRGAETKLQHAGSFKTMAEARERQKWVSAELAGMRLPDLELGGREKATETLRQACERWKASRVDVTESTRVLHRVALNRVTPLLGDRPVDEITTADVNELVAALAEKGKKRETIRKSVKYLAAVLDECSLDGPNPARSKSIRLPHEEYEELNPPMASHVEAVYERLDDVYRLPLLLLDWSGRGCPRSTRRASATTTGSTAASAFVLRRRRRARRSGSSYPPSWRRRSRARSATTSTLRSSRERQRAAYRDRAGVQGCWRTAVLAARPAPPAYLATPPPGPQLGRDRQLRRPAKALTDGRHVHTCPLGWSRARLRGGTPIRGEPSASGGSLGFSSDDGDARSA